MRALLLAAALLPTGWTHVRTGPDGGAVWIGRIPNQVVARDHRAGAVYLPPGFDPTRRYPVIYLLHGMRGAPSEFWESLKLAGVADGLISSGQAPPFIAVMPVAGPVVDPDGGEWAGVWEDYLVRDVVPWVSSHLPTPYLSAGGNHGRILSRWSVEFADELRALRLPHELWRLPASERGHFWSATLPSALLYATSGFGTGLERGDGEAPPRAQNRTSADLPNVMRGWARPRS